MNDIIRPFQKIVSNDSAANQPLPKVEPAQVPPAPKLIEEKLPPLRGMAKKRTWLKWLGGILAFLLIAVVATAAFAYMWYEGALAPVSSAMHNTSFKIDEGATVEQIANQLESEGLVKNSLATQIYMRLNGKTNIKAGNYVLSPHQSVGEITDWLNQGRINVLKVTILPGRTLKDLKSDLTQYGFNEADIEAAFNKKWDHPLLASKPANVNIEGYVYPETYFMDANATAEDLVRRSFDEFEKQLNERNLPKQLADKGFTLHQGITLASIVNSEVSSSEDQRKVSQVFQTRLKEGMTLGSDVTYEYAAELLGIEASPDIESPYNTRKVGGLPPGPISNFNISVLDSILNPANTTYLFFVAGDDGVTHYSYTFTEHEANISKYCSRICSSN